MKRHTISQKAKKIKFDFMTVLHLAEIYHDQYLERNLQLSELQNEASFRDFVHQYTSSMYWGKEPNLVINPEAPLF